MKTSLALVLCTVPSLASAAIGPGQWGVVGQEICLLNNGTFYSTSVPEWAGGWETVGKNVHIFGNYRPTNSSQSMVMPKSGEKPGSFVEWTPDLALRNVVSPAAMVFIKPICDMPAAKQKD